MKTPFEIKRMGIGAILDHTFSTYRANLVQILFFALVISGLVQSACLIIGSLIAPDSVTDLVQAQLFRSIFSGQGLEAADYLYRYADDPFAYYEDLLALSGASSGIGFLVMIFITPFVTAGITNISAGYYHGYTETASGWLKKTGAYYWKLVVLGLCLILVTIGAVIAAVIPAVILMFVFGLIIGISAVSMNIIGLIFAIILSVCLIAAIFFFLNAFITCISMAYPVAVCEGKFSFAAFGRAFKLFFSRFWKAAWTSFLVSILCYVVSFALQLLYTLAASFLPIPVIINNIFVYLLSAVIMPVQIIAIFFIYMDIRITKEGYDLELLAKETDDSME